MSSLEDEMLKALNGKFFWEPSSTPVDFDGSSVEIRRAQRKHAGKNVKVVSTKIAPDVVEIAECKPKPKPLRGQQKVLEPILNAVAKVYNISRDDLVRRTTSHKFRKAKHHFYWAILRYIPKMSYAEAGRILEKCHTTVLHGETMFKKDMDMVKVVEVERELGII